MYLYVLNFTSITNDVKYSAKDISLYYFYFSNIISNWLILGFQICTSNISGRADFNSLPTSYFPLITANNLSIFEGNGRQIVPRWYTSQGGIWRDTSQVPGNHSNFVFVVLHSFHFSFRTDAEYLVYQDKLLGFRTVLKIKSTLASTFRKLNIFWPFFAIEKYKVATDVYLHFINQSKKWVSLYNSYKCISQKKSNRVFKKSYVLGRPKNQIRLFGRMHFRTPFGMFNICWLA